MTNPRTKGKGKPDLLRNFRIVQLKKDGKSSTDIAFLLNTEAGEKIVSPQRVSQIYDAYKDILFRYEDDKVIIQ